MASQPERLGSGLCYEDLPVGRRLRTHRRTVTESDLVQFVNLTWLTEELFATAHDREHLALPERVVPGALVYSFAEGLLLPTFRDTGLAFLGMELTVNAPTRVGDTLHVELEVIESRPTSRPGRGLVRTRNVVVNHNGRVTLTYTPLRLLRAGLVRPVEG